MKLFLAFALMFTTLFTCQSYAGFEGINESGVSLKIFNKIECSTGMTCSRGAKGKFTMATSATLAQDMVISGTTPSLTIGDAGAEDTALIFDGNAQDYYMGLDDTDDKLKIGAGSSVGTTAAMEIDASLNVAGPGSGSMSGFLRAQVASTTTTITASQCGSTFVSDSADVMTLPEASTVLGCRLTFVCGTADDFDINPNDGTDSFGSISTTNGTTAVVTLSPSAGDAIRCTDIGGSITVEAVGADLWAQVGGGNGIWTDVN